MNIPIPLHMLDPHQMTDVELWQQRAMMAESEVETLRALIRKFANDKAIMADENGNAFCVYCHADIGIGDKHELDCPLMEAEYLGLREGSYFEEEQEAQWIEDYQEAKVSLLNGLNDGSIEPDSAEFQRLREIIQKYEDAHFTEWLDLAYG